ncbi:MAG: hypothetical protein LBT43_18525 [Prevotella sp.]|jgi:hypothetical protein|nr:hypothetical protein [Prevotella sp.]
MIVIRPSDNYGKKEDGTKGNAGSIRISGIAKEKRGRPDIKLFLHASGTHN